MMKKIIAFLLLLTNTMLYAQHGVVLEYDDKGNLLSEQTYSNGVLHGQARFYYEGTKIIHSAGNNHNGSKEGLWTFYKNSANREVFATYNYSFGLYQGAYSLISNDTIEKGVYENNKRNGIFKRYSFKVSSNSDTLLTIIDDGSYKSGLKSGLWKHYINGRLNSEGTYRDDKKDMQWKEFDLLSDVNKPSVMREIFYEKGTLEGKWIQHFTYESGKKTDIKINAFYHFGKLNGRYVMMDDFGVIAEGDYSDGLKMGKWKEIIKEMNLIREANYFDDKLVGKVTYKNMAGQLIKEENYKNGIQEGLWIEYDKNQNKIIEANYINGKLNGETTRYNASGIIQSVSDYDNNMLVGYKIYSAGGQTVIAEYIIDGKAKANSPYSVNTTEIIGDTTYSKVYVYTGKLPEDFLTNFSKYKSAMPLTGAFEKSVGNKIIESGYFSNNRKDGVWHYQYLSEILWEVVYVNDVITKEIFNETATKSPFKGDYIVSWPGGTTRFEFKIKNGLRNGKSKWYKVDGTVEKELKYSDGVAN